MSGGWESYIREYNTRRQFLRRAGFVTHGGGRRAHAAGGLWLATTRRRPRPRRSGPAKAPQASGRVDFLSWEGYDIPDPLKSWKSDERRHGQGDLHRQPRRDPGQAQGLRRRRRLRHHHLLPGLQAALSGARHHRAARRAEAAQPEEPLPLLREQGGQLLDRSRRHAHRHSVDLGLDRDHLGHAAGQEDADVVVRPARAGVQGPRDAARRSGGLVDAGFARPGLRPLRGEEGRRREGRSTCCRRSSPRATASRRPSATPRRGWCPATPTSAGRAGRP